MSENPTKLDKPAPPGAAGAASGEAPVGPGPGESRKDELYNRREALRNEEEGAGGLVSLLYGVETDAERMRRKEAEAGAEYTKEEWQRISDGRYSTPERERIMAKKAEAERLAKEEEERAGKMGAGGKRRRKRTKRRKRKSKKRTKKRKRKSEQQALLEKRDARKAHGKSVGKMGAGGKRRRKRTKRRKRKSKKRTKKRKRKSKKRRKTKRKRNNKRKKRKTRKRR